MTLWIYFSGDNCEYINVIDYDDYYTYDYGGYDYEGYDYGVSDDYKDSGFNESTIGLYVKIGKGLAADMNKSIWKNVDKDLLIFNSESTGEWRIGRGSHLNTEDFLFKGKNMM